MPEGQIDVEQEAMIDVETTYDPAVAEETQQTGLADIVQPPTSQTNAGPRKPFAANPAHLNMARKLRGA